MIQLNLLPDVKKEFLKAQRTRNVVISGSIVTMIVAAGIVALLGVFVYGVQLGDGILVDNAIKDKSAQLKKVDELDKYLTIQAQLAALPTLHDSKPIYSRFFDFLPKLNPAAPNNIKISKAVISTADGTIIIEGSGSNYAAVNTFQDTLKNAEVTYAIDDGESVTEKLFDEVTVGQVGLSESSGGQRVVTFNVTLTYNQYAFNATAVNLNVTVPSLETTDSAQEAPRGLFGNNPEQGGE